MPKRKVTDFIDEVWSSTYIYEEYGNDIHVGSRELKEWDWCYVSDKSEQEALEDKQKAIFIYSDKNWTNYCVAGQREKEYRAWTTYNVHPRKYAVPIPKEAKKRRRTRPLTDSQREKAKENNYWLNI